MRAPPSPPRLAKSPAFKEEGLKSYFDKLVVDLIREFVARSTKTEAVDNILLMSPAGKVFKVTVDDAGVLSTTEMAS
jgi:hypothetical protein